MDMDLENLKAITFVSDEPLSGDEHTVESCTPRGASWSGGSWHSNWGQTSRDKNFPIEEGDIAVYREAIPDAAFYTPGKITKVCLRSHVRPEALESFFSNGELIISPQMTKKEEKAAKLSRLWQLEADLSSAIYLIISELNTPALKLSSSQYWDDASIRVGKSRAVRGWATDESGTLTIFSGCQKFILQIPKDCRIKEYTVEEIAEISARGFQWLKKEKTRLISSLKEQLKIIEGEKMAAVNGYKRP